MPTRFSKRESVGWGGKCQACFGQSANGCFQSWIKTQGLMIVGVFVAHRNGEEALAQAFLTTMAHLGLVAMVGKRSANERRKICCEIDFSEQQRTAVRGHGTGRKFDLNRARIKVCKTELIMTDCFQRIYFLFRVFSSHVNMLHDVRYFLQAIS